MTGLDSRTRWLALYVLCLASLMIVLDTTIVNVALPSIRADLAAPLPPKEKAAVVLRYGYDLDYAQIGAALGSSEAAARQAASAGVRRLRKELHP